MKKFVIILLCVLLLAGCTKKTKEYGNSYFSIWLDQQYAFEKVEKSNGDFCLASDEIAIAASRENEEIIRDYGYTDITLEEYGYLAVELLQVDSESLINHDTFYSLEYQAEGEYDTYHYVAMYHNGSYFWTINFICMLEQKEELKPVFERWASSVEFK